jgi:hypothetical protein
VTSLREAWSDAWAQLPQDVHDAMTKEKDGLRLPSDRAIKGFFARAFGSELPTSMRTRPNVYGSTEVGPLEVDQIDLAVKAVSDRLVRTALFLRTFEKLATQDRLRVGDKREALLSFAFDKASEYDQLEVDKADALLDEFLAIPSPSVVTRLLNDDDAAAKLESALATRSLPSPEPFGDAFAQARGVLVAFLNDEHLRYSATAISTEPHADTTTRWEAVRNSDIARWHSIAQGVGLTSLPAPQMPPVRDPRGNDANAVEATYIDHWLDSSLERRLRGALDVNRDARLGLPDERTLLEFELDRAVAPLGLADRDSQVLLALGIALVIGLDQDEPDTRASAIVGGQFARWFAVQKILAGQASIPDHIVNIVDDPVDWYISSLWRRAHGHDVRGTVAHTPQEVWRTLIGIGSTASRRLGELSRKLSNQLRRETRDTIGERVEAVIHHALSIGVDPADLHDFCWDADPADPADVAQWDAWAAGAGVRVTLKQLVQWREKNRPL